MTESETPRERFRRFVVESDQRRASPFRQPRIIAMGWSDYDNLKRDATTQVADLVPTKDLNRKAQEDYVLVTLADSILFLNRHGVECFHYCGDLVIRIESSAVCGPFILNLP